MTRIAPATTPDAKAQEQLAGVKKMLGSTPNLFTTLAHSSSALGYYIHSLSAFSGSKLSAKLREQIAVAVAGVNDCDYCASAHTMFGKMHKLDDAELAKNLKGQSSDAKTQAALAFVQKVVEVRGKVADADLAAVRAAGYDDSEILDMIALVAANTFTNYTNLVARTDVDFPFVSASGATKAAA